MTGCGLWVAPRTPGPSSRTMGIPPAKPCAWSRGRMTAAEALGALSGRRGLGSREGGGWLRLGIRGRWGGGIGARCAGRLPAEAQGLGDFAHGEALMSQAGDLTEGVCV